MAKNENIELLTLNAIPNQGLGAIGVEAIIQSQLSINGKVVLYRAINREPFAPLVEIPFSVNQGQNNFSFLDTSAPIGEEVKYLMRYYFDPSDEAKNELMTEEVLLFTDDLILIDKDALIRIGYNPKVTNFKKNVVDVITPTLGGTYPQVRRNGQQGYYSFNISGLISIQIEEVDSLSCESIKLYDSCSSGKADTNHSVFVFESERLDRINELFLQEKISREEYTILLEKFYRDKVFDFLYSPSTKLFKSLQEGSFFVYLSNITLTPEESAGRLYYSFSCQATEVKPNKPETYEEYWR